MSPADVYEIRIGRIVIEVDPINDLLERLSSDIDGDDFIDFDADVVIGGQEIEKGEETEEESSEDEEEEVPVVTVKQAKESMDVISQFFYANNFISHNKFQSL